MACWQDTIVLTLRVIIDDTGDNPRYSDESLQNMILVSGLMLIRTITFTNNYAINIGKKTISPDPAADNDFVVLSAMKAACLIAAAQERSKSERGIVVRDGPSSIDTRPAAEFTNKWATRVCTDFSDAELQFRIGNASGGRAIIGPYRVETGVYNGYPSSRNSNSTMPYFS